MLPHGCAEPAEWYQRKTLGSRQLPIPLEHHKKQKAVRSSRMRVVVVLPLVDAFDSHLACIAVCIYKVVVSM